MKRLKKKKKQPTPKVQTKCPNCGANEAHFVPPSFGREGFFICGPEPTAKYDKLKKDMK